MPIRFDHLGILSATDQQNADIAAFFTDVLRLPVSGDAADGYAEVDAGAMTIALHRGAPVEPVRPHGGTLLQCSAEDVRAETKAIRSRGGDVVKEPFDTDWGTTSAYVAGPHGVLVELYQWR
jgi:predicted enzyme related to lactoylglutathione lyase